MFHSICKVTCTETVLQMFADTIEYYNSTSVIVLNVLQTVVFHIIQEMQLLKYYNDYSTRYQMLYISEKTMHLL